MNKIATYIIVVEFNNKEHLLKIMVNKVINIDITDIFIAVDSTEAFKQYLFSILKDIANPKTPEIIEGIKQYRLLKI